MEKMDFNEDWKNGKSVLDFPYFESGYEPQSEADEAHFKYQALAVEHGSFTYEVYETIEELAKAVAANNTTEITKHRSDFQQKTGVTDAEISSFDPFEWLLEH